MWNFKLGGWYVMDFIMAAAAAVAAGWFFETIATYLASLRLGSMSAALPFGRKQEVGQASVSPLEFTWIGRMNTKMLTNQWLLQLMEHVYYGMGQPLNLEPPKMIVKMEQKALTFLAGYFIISIWAGWKMNPGLAFAAVLLGFFYLPLFAYKSAMSRRQRLAMLNLPSFVDLLALTIESGLDYLNSMEKILHTTLKKKGPLEEEIDNVLREVQLGYPRRDALRHLAKRMDVPEIRSLVGLLIQSDELGTGLVALLRNYSQDMRNRRLSKAEEQGSKAATKMLMPMMIFIFPVIFALILLPFVYSMMQGKGGGLPF